jgi:hypothetical protein
LVLKFVGLLLLAGAMLFAGVQGIACQGFWPLTKAECRHGR